MTYHTDHERRTLSPDEARQGRIVLRESWQRWIFVGSLVAAAAIAMIIIGIWES